MFTGIIQNLGTIERLTKPKTENGKVLLVVESDNPMSKIVIGESIAINGCCLTVIKQDKKNLTFDLSDETMRKTAFTKLKVGDIVNMERALSADGKFGGHFVLGHVDTVGVIKKIKVTEGSVAITIEYPKKYKNLVIDKGSITIDGISLTACDVKKNKLTVYIIPHTWENTSMQDLKVDDPVNVEFDVLGKYVLNALKK